MGTIYERIKNHEDEDIHPLREELTSFPELIEILSNFTEDTLDVVCKYLLNSAEFLELDFYSACYVEGKPAAVSSTFDGYEYYDDDELVGYPTKDYLNQIIDGEHRIDEPYNYGWHIDDILSVDKIKNLNFSIQDFVDYRKALHSKPKEIVSYIEEIKNLKQKTIRLIGDNENYQALININEATRESSNSMFDDTEPAQGEPKADSQLTVELITAKAIIKQQKLDISKLNKEIENSKTKYSAYYLLAVMKDLLLNPDITGYYFQSDNDNAKKQPTQTALTNHINDMNIKDLKTRNINGIFANANSLLKDAKKG